MRCEVTGKLVPNLSKFSEKFFLLQAFVQWISNPKICNVSLLVFDDILLDHLLQFIGANDFVSFYVHL